MSEFEIMGLDANVLTLELDGSLCEPIVRNGLGEEVRMKSMSGNAILLDGGIKIDVRVEVDYEEELTVFDCWLNLNNPYFTNNGMSICIYDIDDIRFNTNNLFEQALQLFVTDKAEVIKRMMSENNAADKAELECEL